MQFDYVMVVQNIKEAEYRAIELGLNRTDFRYCISERDILGARLPTRELFFISEALYNKMSYFHDDKFYYRLHDRFDKITHISGKELSPMIDVSHKAVFGKFQNALKETNNQN